MVTGGVKQNQVFMPNQGGGAHMYSAGLEANNLVNFYNSNLLDEMLAKNQGKFPNKPYMSAN